MRPLRLIAGPGFPLGLLGMVALIGAAESFLSRNEPDVAGNTTSLEWREIGESIPSKVAGSEILCFGDSLAKMAISPVLLEQRTGLKAYNLAVSGGRAPSSYFLFRKALASGLRPKAVLVDFKWTALETSILAAQRALPEVAGPRDHLEFAAASRDPAAFGALMTAEILPSYRCRFEVRSGVLAAFQGKGSSVRESIEPWYRTWSKNRGAHHTPATPAFNGVIDTKDLGVFRPVWKPDPVNVKFVDRFLKLARDRGIAVYWLITPISPNAQAWREQNGPDAAYSDFVRRFQARFPNLVVVDGRKSRYPDAALHDTSHLNRLGTVAFTAEVATLIRKQISGESTAGLWVNLPAFREPPTADAIEDVYQSVMALRAPSSTKR